MYGVSLMDKTGDFYSLDMGSIPVRRAKIFVDKYIDLSYNIQTLALHFLAIL